MALTSVTKPIPPQDLSGFVGHRFIYTYANGWQYEMYVKNATTIDYRIHSGHVGGRWVKGSGSTSSSSMKTVSKCDAAPNTCLRAGPTAPADGPKPSLPAEQ